VRHLPIPIGPNRMENGFEELFPGSCMEHMQVGPWSLEAKSQPCSGLCAAYTVCCKFRFTSLVRKTNLINRTAVVRDPYARWCRREGPRGLFLSRLGVQMKHNSHYDFELNIIEFDTHGLATKNGIIEMLHSVTELCIQHESVDIIVDHSDLDASQISKNDILEISRHFTKVIDLMKTRKIAHIATKDLQFGLVRMWEIFVEIEGFPDLPLMVFRNKKSAIEWIKTNS
jgi:hypothetical protein